MLILVSGYTVGEATRKKKEKGISILSAEKMVRKDGY